MDERGREIKAEAIRQMVERQEQIDRIMGPEPSSPAILIPFFLGLGAILGAIGGCLRAVQF